MYKYQRRSVVFMDRTDCTDGPHGPHGPHGSHGSHGSHGLARTRTCLQTESACIPVERVAFLLPGFEPGCTQVPVGRLCFLALLSLLSGLAEWALLSAFSKARKQKDAWKRPASASIQLAWAHGVMLPISGAFFLL